MRGFGGEKAQIPGDSPLCPVRATPTVVAFIHVKARYAQARCTWEAELAMSTKSALAVTDSPAEGPNQAGLLVVLVHGSLDRSTSFLRVLRRLRDLHTVVYDRRGYNRSRHVVPLNTTLDGHIDDLLEVVDGRPAVVVGHSYGGSITLGAALRAEGSSIRSVGAYEPPMPWLGEWSRSAATSASMGVAASEPEDPAAAAERFFRRMVGNSSWERLPEEAKDARRADGAALVAELAAIRLSTPPFDVSALTIPATFGRGENSLPRHREVVAWLAGHTPNAELVEFPGADHGAHLTHPDAFAAFVRTAVARAHEPQSEATSLARR
jgi:pimeloyl-ACP methyl ester carboxylesterase